MSDGVGDGRPSEARARLLATATRIFYAEGIHAVGIDRILAEAQVTRATLYRHFAGKEELVVAYLSQVDREIRAQVAGVTAGGAPPVDVVRGIGGAIAEGIRAPGFRGCAFLNAVVEYPDPAHAVHRTVLAHRQWFLDTITDLLARAGEFPAEPAARQFVMLRDGAMTAGCLFDPDLVCETFLRAVEDLLTRGRGALEADVGPA